ncbi:MAG: phosphoribosylformylglycinamidine synthase [Candidatus Cyclobacteriaceae bacterium M3_2C_046]
MILFYKSTQAAYFAVKITKVLNEDNTNKLRWLFAGAELIKNDRIEGLFIGPRVEMITPWSTNAVEITQNMGIDGIERTEAFLAADSEQTSYDPMLKKLYRGLDQDILTINKKPEPTIYIDDIQQYNEQEGLALSQEEIAYLNQVSQTIGRKLTDSEVFGFSQVNSEHCRHKIFNGSFIIDGEEKDHSLFELIKRTSQAHPGNLVSAYKDNVAFIKGPVARQFAPKHPDKPSFFELKDAETVLSLKAETHNFPTTVEPFNGASTGTGGEIRDRMAGGKAGIPLAGTAVYMTSYPRLEDGRPWESNSPARKWLYHTPDDILIKASNGASDFGNKFGQPLICGSLLTFEYQGQLKKYGFDKVIMLAGGVGYAKKKDSLKDIPEKGDKIIVMGGDNYRIGMGGGAVSSVATGEYGNMIELNAVQRANPEMQKRVANAIRALAEQDHNPIISIHDHGAGGHLNCLSELVEDKGGAITIDQLPLGDPTLSAKEIIGNESQERMGLVMKKVDLDLLRKIAERERAPLYVVGEITDDMNFQFKSKEKPYPIDLKLEYLFGKPPKTILRDQTSSADFDAVKYDTPEITAYLENVLQIEAVACKDWLTNKVDRCVTGKVASQQTAGTVQLPLNNVAVVALDFNSLKGIATAIGHAPVPGLIDPAAGSVLAIAESLTNLVWAPLVNGLDQVSLSANWMWPAKNQGENARLYQAVESASEFAIKLGVNIPTGKDSLSMTQKYPDGQVVFSPGTVIISAMGEVSQVNQTVSPPIQPEMDSEMIYIDFSSDSLKLGGSSLAQVLSAIGNETPTVKDPAYFKQAFTAVQELIQNNLVLAGHDISAGGLLVCLLEMLFGSNETGLNIDLSQVSAKDPVALFFSENPGVILQVKQSDQVKNLLKKYNLKFHEIGKITSTRSLSIQTSNHQFEFEINRLRDIWFKTSYLLDQKQTKVSLAQERFNNYKHQALTYTFKPEFGGRYEKYQIDPDRTQSSGLKAAIIREKGINGDREMAYMLYLAGFDVKDVHMTDLISGRETLEDIQFIVFTGGFSNSDVLGSAKGWAGAFLYNEQAKKSLDQFYQRQDTLSLGVCNGCQLMAELGLIYPEQEEHPKMKHNDSGKFECAFVNVDIPENQSVLLKSLGGTRLGIWVAHGEGKFSLPLPEDQYQIPMKYSFDKYPGNPNNSPFATAAICSQDGRHLAMMPHLERSFLPWQWAHYPTNRSNDEVSPWIEAFVNAREWLKKVNSK